MLTPQEVLLNNLKLKVHKKLIFTDLVSSILNITYDAAYRRIKNRTTLSLNEAVILAKRFNISLNSLYGVGQSNSILVTKSKEINNEKDLENYFINIYKGLKPLLKKNKTEIKYSANDLPIFYFFDNPILSKFKIYVWLNLLNPAFSLAKIPFDTFTPDSSLLKATENFSAIFKHFELTEIWNVDIINKTIKQIYHYFEMGLISLTDALIICDDLEKLIRKIEDHARQGFLVDSQHKLDYNLYLNEVVSLRNTIIIKADDSIMALTPYTLLTYYIITHPETCQEMDMFFKKQLESSNLLSKSEEKGRTLFFKALYQKIDRLKTRLKIDDELPLI